VASSAASSTANSVAVEPRPTTKAEPNIQNIHRRPSAPVDER
jgi:hypothetical protein